jgi:glutathione S-transferase
MAIKIYGDAGSGSLRRVTTAAKIMGIELERVTVDLFKGESQTDEFKSRLNPHGLTPVLEDGDTILWEASAINLYLANKVNSPLVGITQEERFQVLQWMFWSGEQWRTFTTTIFDERVGKTVMGRRTSPSSSLPRAKYAPQRRCSTSILRAASSWLAMH